MAYSADTFVADEQPTTAKWNKLWSNDASFNDGTGIADAALIARHYSSASIASAKLSEIDWVKTIMGTAYRVISGTWTRVQANTGTTFGGFNTAQSNGAINEEVRYDIVLGAGTYTVLLHHDKDVNRGIYTITADGSTITSSVDGYAATRVANFISVASTSLTIATSKLVDIRVRMASKNAASPNYYATFSRIEFIRTA